MIKAKDIIHSIDTSMMYKDYCLFIHKRKFSEKTLNPQDQVLDDERRQAMIYFNNQNDIKHTEMMQKKEDEIKACRDQYDAENKWLNRELKKCKRDLKNKENANRHQLKNLIAERTEKEQQAQQIIKLQQEIEDVKISYQQQLEAVKKENAKLKDTKAQKEHVKATLNTEIQNKFKQEELKRNTSNQLDKIEEEKKQEQIQIEEISKIGQSYIDLCSQIYNKINGTNEKLDYTFELNLDLSELKDIELIKSFRQVKLPQLKRINLKCFKIEDESIKQFFHNSFPDQVSNFWLNFDLNGSLQNIENFASIYKTCLQRVSDEIKIANTIINSEQLSELFKASKHCDRLCIEDCMLNIGEDIDFDDGLPYSMKFLSFAGTGHSSRSDWANDKSQMNKIITAIAGSSLKNSLQEINVHGCGVSTKEVLQVLEENGVSDTIKVTDHQILMEIQ